MSLSTNLFYWNPNCRRQSQFIQRTPLGGTPASHWRQSNTGPWNSSTDVTVVEGRAVAKSAQIQKLKVCSVQEADPLDVGLVTVSQRISAAEFKPREKAHPHCLRATYLLPGWRQGAETREGAPTRLKLSDKITPRWLRTYLGRDVEVGMAKETRGKGKVLGSIFFI